MCECARLVVHDPCELEYRYCAEHIAVGRLGEDLEGYYHALESIRAFLESEAVKEDPFRALNDLALECVTAP